MSVRSLGRDRCSLVKNGQENMNLSCSRCERERELK